MALADQQHANLDALSQGVEDARMRAYFRYLIEKGGIERYGTPFWQTDERRERVELERAVIEEAGFQPSFIMLAQVMDFMRREKIVYGPGRGSVGGCYVAYLMGIHEVDSIEHDLLFERFMNPDRVSYPDVDIDISQRDRVRVLRFVMDTFTREDQIVLQIPAFVRAGGRAVVDMLLAANSQSDPEAGATATNLKKCFPEKGNITGGLKVPRELAWWLENGHGNKAGFKSIAEQAGWMDALLKLDGMFTHVGRHAAGLLILRRRDLPTIPRATVRNEDGSRSWVAGYDMYSLDDLGYPKWDFLGLRTLDTIADAHKFMGGSGETRDLIRLWQDHKDEPEPYRILQDADTMTIFQMDTPGFQRTLRDFQPTEWEHIVQLVALYRPGALDYVREDGKNMVEVFIDRHRGREIATYDHPDLEPILGPTHGIILYQEQAMQIVRTLAGFTRGQADSLRKAIGKKRPEELAKLKPLFVEGCRKRGIQDAVIERMFTNIEAAGRYSWNRSHAVEYGAITWLTCWFKVFRAPIYAAEINSLADKRERQANVIAEARQHVEFRPPDVNVAEDGFTVVSVDGRYEIVFGLNGIKGMGDANRNAILIERLMGGPFTSFADFCRRLPSVPVNMKTSLVACGAFDNTPIPEDRRVLLAKVTKPGPSGKRITVAEWINHYSKAKNPKPVPTDITDYAFPGDIDIAAGEMDAMGYYISAVPLKAVTKALSYCPPNATFGGEIASVKVHRDRNDNEMGTLTVLSPALTRQTVRIFASNWAGLKHRIQKGAQLLFRGRMDGNAFLADAVWEPGDYRHFGKIKLTQGDEKKVLDFDGTEATIQRYEREGWRVRLL